MKFEERWTEEAGGLMLGVGRTIKGDRAIGFEFLRRGLGTNQIDDEGLVLEAPAADPVGRWN